MADSSQTFVPGKSNAFDPLYWKYLDTGISGEEKIFGIDPREGYEGRLTLLFKRKRAQMERLIAWKLEA